MEKDKEISSEPENGMTDGLAQGLWCYSPEHRQLCQVIELQTLWGETTCRVWLPGRDFAQTMNRYSL